MKSLLIVLFAIWGTAARCEGIGEVLDRSQLQRLDAFTQADTQSPAALRVRESFDALMRATGLQRAVELRVVTGEVIAETIQGRVIVANQALGDLSEGARLFVLAHEIGHISLAHWPKMTLLYQAWLPGELVQASSDAVAALLGRDASELSYRQEFEADAFALRTLRLLGRPWSDTLSAFTEMGVFVDGPTHPGTRKRLAALRQINAELDEAGDLSAWR